MKIYVLVFCFLLVSLLSFGQEGEHAVLQGTVVSADSLQPLPYVHVRAKNTTLGAVTQIDGKFNLRVPKEDSIVFSIVGYKPYLVVPADSAEADLKHMLIKMVPEVVELSGVKVKEYIDITKYIRREYDTSVDLKRHKGTPMFEEQEPEQKKAVGFSNNHDMKPANLEGALTAFANLFNEEAKQEKKLKKILEIEELEKRQQSLQQMMTEKYQEMVLFVANLTYAELQDFTEIYMPNPNLMAEMNDYGIIEGIMLDLEQFKPEAKKDQLTLEQQLQKATFRDRETMEKVE